MKVLFFLRWLAVLIVVSASMGKAVAEQGGDLLPQADPAVVEVGIYLSDIPSITFKEKKFQVDFKVFFRWEDGAINPAETFEIVNGHIDNKELVVTKKVGSMNYALVRVEATIHRNFDMSRYPMDAQAIKIQMEDRSGRLVYQEDKANSDTNPKISVPGWVLGKAETYASTTKYKTTYGDPSLASGSVSVVPRLTMAVAMQRAGNAFLVKNFSLMILAAYCAFAAFLVRADHIDARLAFSLSAVFIASNTQGLLAASLPDGEGLTLGDVFYQTTVLFIVLSVVGSVRTFRDFLSGDEARAIMHSTRYAIALSLLYPATLLLISRLF